MPVLRNTLSNIRFWILLLFLVRLFAITDPPLEVAHNWRQTTVTMSARNFYETDSNLFYPRIDIAGEKTGITGMEFPLLNYLIYLVSLVFGYAHWYGRLINLVISSIGLLYFYKLLTKYFSASLAFNATLILLFSVWFTYSRKIMPDTFSMSLVIIGIYHATKYFDGNQKIFHLLLSFLFVLLGALSKLPSAYLLVVFLPFIFNKKIQLPVKIVFVIVQGIGISMVLLYYFIWVPHLNKQFGFEHFYMGTGLLNGIKEILHHWEDAFEKFYLEALQISGFLLFIVGLVLMLKHQHKTLIVVFSITAAAYLFLMAKAGFAFYHHSYYIIPFAPVMAMIAANSLEHLKNNKIKYAILLFVCLEGVLNKMHDFHIKDNFAATIKLEQVLDKLGKRSDLIIINSGNVPTPMYFAHRKGWVSFNYKLANAAYIDSLKTLGLKHIVILEKVFGETINLDYTKVYQNSDFTIYAP